MSGNLATTHSAPVRVDAAVTGEAAFGLFYERNIDSLTRSLAIALGNDLLAQEAAQEAMTRACERWESIERYDNPAGWCYRVGLNWATSRWRKRRREVITDQPQTEHAPSNPAQPDIELQDQIMTALTKLSIDHRSVIVLRLIEDWSIADTAEALGIAPGTVQSRYARAINRLRQELGTGHE